MVRILIVAKPSDGRPIEAVLRSDGHEIHRTPTDFEVETIIARLRPHLVIVDRDLPWGGGENTVRSLQALLRPGALLLLGKEAGESVALGVPWLPTDADPFAVRATIRRLLDSLDPGNEP